MLQVNDESRAIQRDAKRSKTISLQWLRAVAALMVVLYHAAEHMKSQNGSTWGTDIVPGWYGAVGVSLFFALSGYLMSRVMGTTSAGTFLTHRIARIYPTFLIATGAFLAAGLVTGLSPPVSLKALTLLPFGPKVGYPLGVEWTLIFQIVFYVFVFLLILFKKQAEAISFLTGWLMLIVINNVLRPDDPSVNLFTPSMLPFASLNVAFVAGMLLPLVVKQKAPHPLLAVIFAVAAFYVGVSHGIIQGRWLIGIGSAVVVLSLARHKYSISFPGLTTLNAIGDRLGGYSYALYLVHVPVIRTAYLLLPPIEPGKAFSIAVAGAILLSVPFGEMDLFICRKLKARIDAWNAQHRRAFAVAFACTLVAVAMISKYLV